jgi:hypothetical protein
MLNFIFYYFNIVLMCVLVRVYFSVCRCLCVCVCVCVCVWYEYDLQDTCSPMFIAALFIITRSWKELRWPSAEEWIQKMWYIYKVE